ncbi:MAG TPA: BTAD domain-containing putative transcriptional regulator [Nocardioidaceae bacterium]|nr:BTAD domain-containing putative transcriptional regulator [Nocardioidaceae bacterium]
MLFRVLGPLEALLGASPIVLGGAQQRALLAILLVHANRPVSTDTLIDLIWGDKPPASAAKVVQVYVSQLRKAMEYVDEAGTTRRGIVTRAGGYVLEASPDELDATQFEGLVARGRRAQDAGDHAQAVELLSRGLALWRGTAFAGFEFEQFAAPEVARLEDLRLSASEARIESELALGRHAEATVELDALLAQHPSRESLGRLLMLALYRSGRQADALERFRTIRSYLSEELGLEPSVELRELHQLVLSQDDSLRWAPRGHTAHNLPSPATSFRGRSDDLDRLTRLLERGRLITLTGAGGCGKSRLAVELARSPTCVKAIVRLVELAEITTARDLWAALAGVLAGSEGIDADLARVVIATVRGQEALLVLDNAEHLVDDVVPVVRRLLSECPRLQVVVTSREALAIHEEHAYAVGPLTEGSAIDLFRDRATAAAPGLRFDEDSLEQVAQIVRRVDGLPLALELAASLVRAMSPAEISARLDDEFDVLDSDTRSSSARHRSLRDMVEWSFALLDDEERSLLQGLSVFSGGFSLPAVEVVGAAGAVTCLTRLVRKSLVYAEDRAGAKRYRLLETIGAYAGEALDSAGLTQLWESRHAAYFLALAEEAEPHLKSSGQLDWLRGLRREDDNLRAALQFFISENDVERECRLTAALWRPSYLSGHYTACRGWLEAALKHDEVSPDVRVGALHGAGALALYQCDYEVAGAHLSAAQELYTDLGDDAGRAGSLTLLGSIARERGELDVACSLHSTAEQLYRRAGDDWGIAQNLELTSLAYWLAGEFELAWERCGEALQFARKVEDDERIGWCRVDLAAVAHYLDDDADEARRQLGDAMDAFEALGFQEGTAWALNLLGLVQARSGDTAVALVSLTESLRVHRELGDRWRIGSVLEAIAHALVTRNEHHDAAILLKVTERLRDDLGTPVPPCERSVHAATVAAVRANLDDAALRKAHRRAGTLSLDEACTRVLDVIA